MFLSRNLRWSAIRVHLLGIYTCLDMANAPSHFKLVPSEGIVSWIIGFGFPDIADSHTAAHEE